MPLALVSSKFAKFVSSNKKSSDFYLCRGYTGTNTSVKRLGEMVKEGKKYC